MTVGLNFRHLVVAVLAASALGILAVPARAGTAIIIGPDLSTAPTNTFSCNIVGGCTYSHGAPTYTSPISGTVVGWIVRGGSGPLTFRIISGDTGGVSSEVRSPPTFGVECLSTSLPINAGDRIGVDLPAGFVSNIGVRQLSGPSVDAWTPALGNGQTLAPGLASGIELLLDAVIQPLSGPPSTCPPTGRRAAALKKCRKKFKKNHNKKTFKKCKEKAKLLPV